MEIRDMFLGFDFDRNEAFALLMQWLDRQVYEHAST
jgi:hypothetical protein